jgi:hypothetical protein
MKIDENENIEIKNHMVFVFRNLFEIIVVVGF